jgi:CelD/BcsL family acetyltransferase involved in cellulose biosynthesis
MLHVEVLTTIEQFSELEPVWDALLACSDIDVPFMTFAWFSLWFRQHAAEGRRLVCVVRDGAQIAAIAPLWLGPRRFRRLTVRMLGFAADYYSCRAGIICARFDDAVLPAILDGLRERGIRYDMISLELVVKDSRTDRQIQSYLEARQKPFCLKPGENSPYIIFDRGWEEFSSGLSRNLRSKINITGNRLKKTGICAIAHYTAPESVPQAMKELMRVSRKSKKFLQGRAIANSRKNAAGYAQLARLLAENGWLHIWILHLGDVPIAFLYNIDYKDTVYGLQLGYDAEYQRFSPGQFLLHAAIRQAGESGKRAYDMLGKEDPHKLRYARQCRPHHQYFIFEFTLKGMVLGIVERYLVPAAAWLRRFLSGQGMER